MILLNLNLFHFYGGRIHALTGGIMNLLYSQTPPVLPVMHHPILYPVTIRITIVTGLLILWAMRVIRAWRRWQRQPAQQPQGWRKVGAIYLPLPLPAGWSLLLLVGVPQALYPLLVLLINIPDVGIRSW